MTLTEAQVQDLQTTVKADLVAGTWALHDKAPAVPTIHTTAQKKNSKKTWIELLGSKGNIIQAMNGAIIMFNDRLELGIHAQNRSNLDKLYADTLNILVASSNAYVFARTQDKPKRSKYEKRFVIILKDI